MEEKKRKKVELIIFFVACCIGFISIRATTFGSTGDDAVYKASIETWGSWGKWAEAYYNGNSGRVLIHAILIIFLNLPIIFYKLISSIMIGLTCFIIYRMACIHSERRQWLAVMCLAGISIGLFFFIPQNVSGSSIRWAPGALNYLYPVCMLLVSMYPFYLAHCGRAIGRWVKLAGFVAVWLCANMEQAGAVLLAMGVLFFVYRVFAQPPLKGKLNKKDRNYLILIWCINLIVSLIGYMAPGNAERFAVEMLQCPGYGMYTVGDKMIMGIQLYVLYNSAIQGFILWCIPSGIAVLKALKKRSTREIILPIINVVLHCIQFVLIRTVFDLEFIHPYNYSYYVWLVFTIGLLFLNGQIILRCLNRDADRFWYLFLYYGAVAVGVVPCFSPTIYVSAARTMYISFVLLVLIIVKLISELIECEKKEKNIRLNMTKVNIIIGVCITIGIMMLFLGGVHHTKKIDVKNIEENTVALYENTYKDERGRIKTTIDVTQFAYVADNWCTGTKIGYDVNVQIGIMNVETKEVTLYKTCPNPQYAHVDEYPDNKLEITGYLRDNIYLKDNEEYVIISTTHDGNKSYAILDLDA